MLRAVLEATSGPRCAVRSSGRREANASRQTRGGEQEDAGSIHVKRGFIRVWTQNQKRPPGLLARTNSSALPSLTEVAPEDTRALGGSRFFGVSRGTSRYPLPHGVDAPPVTGVLQAMVGT